MFGFICQITGFNSKHVTTFKFRLRKECKTVNSVWPNISWSGRVCLAEIIPICSWCRQFSLKASTQRRPQCSCTVLLNRPLSRTIGGPSTSWDQQFSIMDSRGWKIFLLQYKWDYFTYGRSICFYDTLKKRYAVRKFPDPLGCFLAKRNEPNRIKGN